MKAVLFYPWGGLMERKSGASQRVGFLIDYLKNECEEIRVLATGGGNEVSEDNVLYTFYRERPLNAVSASASAVLSLLTLGRGGGEDFMLRYHYQFRLDPSFVQNVKELVNWADVVFLEYTFWAVPVVKAARRKGIKVILSTHDVLSDQVKKNPLLKRLILREEVGALKMADYAVCVSESDRETFARYGVNAEVIPHGIDTELCKGRLSDDVIRSHIERMGLPFKNICLFVGSFFDANIKAVAAIRKMAGEMDGGIEARVNFIVVGNCAEPERKGNFYAIGKVEAEILHALYQLADIVLVPLSAGTGASVKTIEAMAYGKALLGTRVGFRGYRVEDNVNCIVSDDLESYPSLIRGLLNSPEKKLTLETNARKFAEAYDYRICYTRYLEMMAGPA